MYCPKCEKGVITKEEEFNVALAIILAIFTGGLGLLIYLAVYMDRKHRCIHCNSVCKTQIIENQPISGYQALSVSNQMHNQKSILITQSVEGKAKYCYNCGSELEQSENTKFCRLCGSTVD
jgi:hypothetical protein